MNKHDDNIFLNNADGSITFNEVWKIIKCSLLRLVVYLLVACLLASTITFVMSLVNTADKSVSTTIAYKYDDIDKGLSPDGTPFSIDKIKNENVLSKAIYDSSLQDVDDLDATSLSSHIEIEGVIPHDMYVKIENIKKNANNQEEANKQIAALKYYPSVYNVKIDKFDELGIDEGQAIELLTNVIKSYQAMWNNTYIPNNFYVDTEIYQSIKDGKVKIEYAELKTYFEEGLDGIDDYLSIFENGIKLSSKESLAITSLKNRVDAIRGNVNSFDEFVNVNKVYTLSTQDEAKSALALRQSNIESDIANLNANKATLNDELKNINATTKDSTELARINRDISKINSKLAKANEELSSVKMRLGALNSSKVPVEGATWKATESKMSICDDLMILILNTKEFGRSYTENMSQDQMVERTNPVARPYNPSYSNKVIMAVFLVCIATALIAGIVVTIKKQKAFAFTKLDKAFDEEPVILEEKVTFFDDKVEADNEADEDSEVETSSSADDKNDKE